MRALGKVVAVVLVLVAVLMTVVAVSLFVDGSVGAGVLATLFTAVCVLAAGLLLRSRATGPSPRRSQRPRRDQELYYGDTSVPYGYAGAGWTGDGGADGRHDGGSSGHGGHDYGSGGSFASDGGSSSGSDGGGGGSDGGGGGGGSD